MSATASPRRAGWKVQGVVALAARFGLFPPAAGADHVVAAVAVEVADAQAVRELEGAGDGLAGAAGLADRVHLPGLRRVAAGREPGHLAFVVLALGLPAHDQHALAVAEQVGVERRLVAGAVPDLVLGPVARLALGVFVPVGGLAGEADDDLVGPAVAVDVVGPAGHALAVAVQAVAVIAGLADVVLVPGRGLVPGVADEDVDLAVLVDVGDRHALGAELALDHRLLPRDGRGLVVPMGGAHRQQDRRQAECGRRSDSYVHGS